MANSNMQSGQAMQLFAPDLAQEQQQLSRRQQLADMLRKQSLESSGPTEMVGGWAVKKSPYEGLAKLAQALAANYVQDKTDTRQLEIAKEADGRMGAAFGEGTSSPSIASSAAQTMGASQQPSTPDATGAMVNQGGVGPTNDNAARMGNILAQGAGTAPQGGGLTIPGMTPKQAKLAFMLDQNAYMGSYLKQFDQTEMQKNDRYQGIAPAETAASTRAERNVKGTQIVAQNSTALFPNGSSFTAPDYTNGFQGKLDANGNASVSAIANSAEIAAARAGQVKFAEARGTATANDPFKVPTAVDTATGRYAMTDSQQRTLAHGGVDPAYPNAPPTPSMIRPPNAAPPARGKNTFASTEIEKDQAAIFQGEMNSAKERLATAKTPDESARAKSDLDNIGREMSRLRITPNTAQAPQSVGIKLQDDAQKAAEIATAKIAPENIGKVNDTWLKTSYEPLIAAKSAHSNTLASISQSRTAMNAMGGTGWGTEAKASAANVLTGLGIGGKDVAAYASNAQVFQQAAMDRLQAALALQKGAQTEGDATRQQSTYAALKNTPQANSYILDSAQASAEREIMKTNFYQSAMPIASKKGDLQEIDREWNKRAPSLFSMPSMQKWGKK